MPKTSLTYFFDAVESQDFESVIKHGNDVLGWLNNGHTYPGHITDGLIPLVESAINAAEESIKASKRKHDLIEEIVNFNSYIN